MIVLPDSSVWIDYLRGADTAGAMALDRVVDTQIVLLGDLVIAEVLRGVSSEKQAQMIVDRFGSFEVVHLGGKAVAIEAARFYRLLRSKAVTIRGTVDLLIGTWCILNDVPLLHGDRDFAGMERHLGLKSWPAAG